MPTYQYVCTECGHDLEAVQSFTDDALTVCPDCSGRLRKVYGSVGVVFKGPGFYRTDSRNSSTIAPGSSKSGSKSDSSKSDGSKSESAKSDSSTSSSSSSGSSSGSSPAKASASSASSAAS